MKHKAQVALDKLADGLGVTSYLLTENNSKEPLSNKYTNTIQQSISNTLTVEELRTISTAINHLEVDYLLDDLLNSEKKSLKRIPGIRDKINNQKEMWEAE